MTRVVCPGSFDPVTRGHLDIIERASGLFEGVLVAVGNNSKKGGLFSPTERVAMLREVCAALPAVSVHLFDGLLVDFCRAHDASGIVKGLRFVTDFDYELPMAQMNSRLTGVETVFLPTAPQWSYVSSSLVREVAGLGGDVAPFLPPAVVEATLARVQQLREG